MKQVMKNTLILVILCTSVLGYSSEVSYSSPEYVAMNYTAGNLTEEQLERIDTSSRFPLEPFAFGAVSKLVFSEYIFRHGIPGLTNGIDYALFIDRSRPACPQDKILKQEFIIFINGQEIQMPMGCYKSRAPLRIRASLVTLLNRGYSFDDIMAQTDRVFVPANESMCSEGMSLNGFCYTKMTSVELCEVNHKDGTEIDFEERLSSGVNDKDMCYKILNKNEAIQIEGIDFRTQVEYDSTVHLGR